MKNKITDNTVKAFHKVEGSPEWILRMTEKYLIYVLRTHTNVRGGWFKQAPYSEGRRDAFLSVYFFHDVVDSLTKIIQVAHEKGVEAYATIYKDGNVAENLNLLKKWITFHLEWTEKEERKIFLTARQHLMELRGQSLLYQVKLSEISN